MTEQGLKAVVYPELDEYAMQEFVKQIGEYLGNSSITIGANVSGTASPASSPSSGGGGDDTAVEKTSTAIANKTGEKVAEKLVEKLGDVLDGTASLKDITKSLGGILGKGALIGTAVGVGAIGVVEIVSKTFKFLEASSEPLRKVMSLFTTAFNLIWMPVGTILAIQLMPFLTKTFARVGDFVSKAMELYEEGGWGAVIAGALETSFDVLISLLTETPFLEAIFTVLFTLWDKLNPTQLLLRFVLGTDGPLITTMDLIKLIANTVMMNWHFIEGLFTGDWSKFGEDWENQIKIFDNMGKTIVDQLGNIWDRWGPIIATISPFKEVIQIYDLVGDLVETLTGKSVGEHWDTFTENTKSGWDSMVDSFSSGDILGGLGKALEGTPGGQLVKGIGSLFHAEGGIVTSPQFGIVGEAGPEAIIPLNQLHQVANDYRTVTGSGSGNVMNFYINGSNAMEVGEEVQRILEKTVGKASSKLMWW